MSLFERITGKKTDRWLVQMVGLLAVTIGISLLVDTREEPNEATLTLATASALSFAAIDIIHSARQRISPIYLADALVELALIALVWADAGAEDEHGK